jgi:hypothetical protein
MNNQNVYIVGRDAHMNSSESNIVAIFYVNCMILCPPYLL